MQPAMLDPGAPLPPWRQPTGAVLQDRSTSAGESAGFGAYSGHMLEGDYRSRAGVQPAATSLRAEVPPFLPRAELDYMYQHQLSQARLPQPHWNQPFPAGHTAQSIPYNPGPHPPHPGAIPMPMPDVPMPDQQQHQQQPFGPASGWSSPPSHHPPAPPQQHAQHAPHAQQQQPAPPQQPAQQSWYTPAPLFPYDAVQTGAYATPPASYAHAVASPPAFQATRPMMRRLDTQVQQVQGAQKGVQQSAAHTEVPGTHAPLAGDRLAEIQAQHACMAADDCAQLRNSIDPVQRVIATDLVRGVRTTGDALVQAQGRHENALAVATAWQNEPGAKVGPRLSSMHTSTGDTSM